MTHVAYRTALSNIAAAEAEGENVLGDIVRLAAMTGIPSATIRHEVTEIADL